MNRFTERGTCLAFLFVAIASSLCFNGCGNSSPIPAGQVAKSSLETALTAWKSGKPMASLAESKPPIQAIDTDWATGRKLEGFEILGEEPSTTDKRFKVKLKHPATSATAKNSTEVETVFIVIGIDPVSVFREADFNRSLNMDNNPTTKPARKTR
jgi:hypothetical protein